MTMKKLLALLLVLVMVVALVACGSNGNETEAPTDASQPASDATENNDNTDNSDTSVGTDLKVAVLLHLFRHLHLQRPHRSRCTAGRAGRYLSGLRLQRQPDHAERGHPDRNR